MKWNELLEFWWPLRLGGVLDVERERRLRHHAWGVLAHYRRLAIELDRRVRQRRELVRPNDRRVRDLGFWTQSEGLG